MVLLKMLKAYPNTLMLQISTCIQILKYHLLENPWCLRLRMESFKILLVQELCLAMFPEGDSRMVMPTGSILLNQPLVMPM